MPGTMPSPLTVGSHLLCVRIFREWGSPSLCLASTHIGWYVECHQLCPEYLTLLASIGGTLGPFPFVSSTLCIAWSRLVDTELSFGGGEKHGERDGKDVSSSWITRGRFSQGDTMLVSAAAWYRHLGSVSGRTVLGILISEASFLQPFPHLVSHTSGSKWPLS